jgi:two-component system sensor histidine kinase UhpB
MVDALAEVVTGWRQREAGIELEARLPEVLPEVAPNAGLALYRTLQEALTNVLRHSGARRAWVTVTARAGGVNLVVCDDGCGRAANIRPGGGLMGMRERAEMAGGRLVLGNADEGGLQLQLWLPGTNNEEEDNDDTHPAARRSRGGAQRLPAAA